MTELVHLEIESGIATITLDSPHNRNALSAQLRGELHAHLTSAIDSDAVRAIVLTHTGTVFCAGMDLKESRGASASEQGVADFPETLRLIWTSPTPVIARLAGPARAGGVGLISACDLAIAADTVTFAFTEVRIGVVPAVISVPLVPQVQPAALHELFLTGETFDARRAAEIGLITKAVPADGLDAEVTRYAEMLRLGAPSALAATKVLLRGSAARTMSDDLAAMAEVSAERFASEEGQEGIRAFMEKRKPSWAN
ncbi:enoyl-CoA hydratase-related protein [Pseudonocardia spinosispora]|uniref:enoyl-CoA hydratase-related protein n=1 Tax=Pseudonocardia spinosispora TaxID=103441 RepID=UPI0003FAA752|nr:enoyl-CoA hydratase-related protein [Pseudonocardia spinosispora]